MTPVQGAWLTLVLAPVALIALTVGFVASRPKPGREVPPWAKGVKTVGLVAVLLVAFIQIMTSPA